MNFIKVAPLLFIFSFDSIAQNNIQYYFDNLPDTCFYLCDWRDTTLQYAHKTVDLRHGFISIKTDEEFPDVFQVALFRGSEGKDFIIVSTRECEAFACFHYTSFFYIYHQGDWIEAENIILPDITTSLFYDDSLNHQLLDEYGYFRYNYILPQFGKEVVIELKICDYLQFDHPEVTDQQYHKLIEERKTVHLEWNKEINHFDLKQITPVKSKHR